MRFLPNSYGLIIGELSPDQESSTTLFYFACSARDSLSLDPLSQPAIAAVACGCRVISIDLPFHQEGVALDEALEAWNHAFEQGEDPFHSWFDRVEKWIRQEPSLQHQPVGLMGLSRGGFIGKILAQRLSIVKALLLFAPLLDWEECPSFQESAAEGLIPSSYLLLDSASSLSHVSLRVYIGNQDRRVGVRPAFELVEAVARAQADKRIFPSPSELIIRPSIGYMGHGTTPETFSEGAQWAASQLKS